ncbi:unnamed protein product [Lymnaea stagnalis]|uniref:Clarin-1 n=1 Tax=Lymnaea stagnalis TaxID=6523 RepID=A0AAV2ILK2_LYMST
MALIHRRLIGLSAFVAVIGVGLIVAAFATDHWINSSPVSVNNGTTNVNATGGSLTGHTANITFGLFTGLKKIDFGLGIRESNLMIKCDQGACIYAGSGKDEIETPEEQLASILRQYKNQSNLDDKTMAHYGLFSFPLYVVVLVMLVLAIVWGLVAIGFAIFNVFGRPIETITGPTGLYLWNILACIFALTAIGCYLGLYFTQLKVNILRLKDQDPFSSKDHTNLDMSFYFVVGAVGAFLFNQFILCFSGQKCSCDYHRSGEKEVDSGMILY